MTPSHAADWPQFLGPNRDGISPSADLAPTWPASGPTVVWQRKVGAGFAGPVVAGGKLILFHRVDNKETIECLDAATGKPVWSAAYPTQYVDDFGFDEGPRATPTIADNRVYTFGADGALNCWDFVAGKNIWSIDTRAKFRAGKGFFGMVCSPLVEGKAVIVNIGGQDGHGIVAFDKSNGNILWHCTDDEASYSSPVAATFAGKRYILAFTRAGLAALEPAAGKVMFQYPFRSRSHASVNAATPLVIDDHIFLSASYQTGAALLKFNEAGPEKIWANDESLSNHYATSVYHDGFLYGFDGRQEMGPNLRCVDLKTGKVQWSEDSFGAGTLMVAGNSLLILREKGELILAPATPKEFKPAAKAQILGFECRAYPALADGLYYARSKDRMVCVKLK